LIPGSKQGSSSKAGEKELPCTNHLPGISHSVSKKRKKKIRLVKRSCHAHITFRGFLKVLARRERRRYGKCQKGPTLQM
jgi:hypothetical protein